MDLKKLEICSINKLMEIRKKTDLRKKLLIREVRKNVGTELLKEDIHYKNDLRCVKIKKQKSVSATELEEKLFRANEIKEFLEKFVEGGIGLESLHRVLAIYCGEYVEGMVNVRHRNLSAPISNLVRAEILEKNKDNENIQNKDKKKNKKKRKNRK